MSEPLLKNVPKKEEPKKEEPKKEEPRLLSETDSLRCENVDLKTQVLQLKKKILELEEAILIMTEEQQKIERASFLKQIGIATEGRVVFSRKPNGRYEVSSGDTMEKV
jgi:hypothetical protein